MKWGFKNMGKEDPRGIALLTAIAVSFITAIMLSITAFISHYTHALLIICTTTLLIFLCTYFIAYYAIERFIYRKIKVIYKTIHRLKRNPKDKVVEKEDFMSTDIINKVNEEVEKWYTSNLKEIAQLQDRENFRKEFIGNVAHELKTPIFNIQGYVLTLLEGGLEDPVVNREYLERTEKSVQRMITLTEDLDMISKLESGGMEIQPEKIDIMALTQEIFKSLELKAKDNHTNLIIGEYPVKNIWVMADRARISQVLSNLLVNSMKYGNFDGTTTVNFIDMDENILVEVTDNGIGIEEEHLSRLFERFYRVDKSRSRQNGGTGLGLAIVKHIIEAHKQTINVRSKKGVGSTFSFTLQKA